MTVELLYLVINSLIILEKNYSPNYITFSNYEKKLNKIPSVKFIGYSLLNPN